MRLNWHPNFDAIMTVAKKYLFWSTWDINFLSDSLSTGTVLWLGSILDVLEWGGGGGGGGDEVCPCCLQSSETNSSGGNRLAS